MTLHTSAAAQGGPVEQSQARPAGATLAPLKSPWGSLQECTSKKSLEQACLGEPKMGNTTSAPQDAINLSCLPEEFVEGLRSVAEVKQHEKNGRYELGERGALPDTCPSKVTVFIDVDETIVYVTPIPLLKVVPDRVFAFSEPVAEEGASRAYTATPLPPVSLEEAAAAAKRFDPNASPAILYVYHRPFVKRLLTELRDSGKFEIVAFTAALPEYANPILDSLEDEEKLFDHRLYRHHCCRAPCLRRPRMDSPTVAGEHHWPFCGEVHYYVKDLAHAAHNRDLRRCVLLDNSPVSFAAQMENGIYLRPFSGDPGDDELQFLSNMLFQLHKLEDVRGGLQTGLINAAWRSLVERDDLYEIAGIPRPARELDLGDQLASPVSLGGETHRSVEEAEEVLRGLSQIDTQAVSAEVSIKVEGSQVQVNGSSPLSTKGQEDKENENNAKAMSNGPPRSLRNSSASTASLDVRKTGSSRHFTRHHGDKSESQVSLHVPKDARRTPGQQVPLSTARSQRSSRHGMTGPGLRSGGHRTPRLTDHSRNEKDMRHYTGCYEAGRARVEAGEARTLVNNCRDSRRSLAISESASARKTDERNHTVSCLKRQEREGTTWCTCTGTKSSDVPAANRDTSRRRSGSVLTDSTEGMRNGNERRSMRRGRKSSRERFDAFSVSSSSCYASSARIGKGERVPRLHLQGLGYEERERSADWSLTEGVGEEPLTPGKQPLTPTARKARLANIEQILEDSVALSRQCPEPMAQSRGRLRQPVTMYGCPDLQAPILLCGREEARRPSEQGRLRARPQDRLRKGKEGAEFEGNIVHAAPQPPVGVQQDFSSALHPTVQYPGYPLHTTQQQVNFGAARQQIPLSGTFGAAAGWPSTPRFLDANARAGPAALHSRNVSYASGTPRVIGLKSGYEGSPVPMQIPCVSTTPTKDYASLRQQVTGQSQPWGPGSPGPQGIGSWTPQAMGGQQYQLPTTTSPCQGIPVPMTARAMGRGAPRQQEPKLFAGRRMRLGDLFGSCGEKACPPRPQTGQSDPGVYVRPAVFVRGEESPKSPRSGAQQRLLSSPTASRPLIMPYASPMMHTPHSHPIGQPAGTPSFMSTTKISGGFGRASLPPPERQGGMRAVPSLPSFYPIDQQRGSHVGIPTSPVNWPWTPRPGMSPPLSASMSVLPRFS